MPEPLKRSVTIAGHRTSISLEPEFWDALLEIADSQKKPTQRLIEEIDEARSGEGLSSAVRVYVLKYFRKEPRPAG